MKILVTGGQGFVGSYICQDLLKNDHKVISVDNYSKYGKISRPQDTHKKFTFIELDITNREKFGEIVDKYKPDILVAAAALISGVESYNKLSFEMLDYNNQIMSSTLNASIDSSVKRIIMLSTLMVYENIPNDELPASELDQIPMPDNPYSVQKLCSERLCQAAEKQYGLKYTILRLGNAVGVGEDKHIKDSTLALSHVIPDLIRKIMILKQDPVEIIGSLETTRSFINGKDIARAIRMCIDNPGTINNIYNITNDEETSIGTLAELIWKKINGTKKFNYKLLDGFKSDVKRSFGRNHWAQNEFEFLPEVSLNKSIDEVIEYIKTNG